MSAIDQIQAAIDTLTYLRAEATRGRWQTDSEEPGIAQSDSGTAFVKCTWDEDGDLIVTLHRTIDAQLAILSAAKVYAAGYFPGADAYANALTLARAITGTVS